MIYFTSDLHFGHDKEFIYKNRGFNSIKEHDQAIINNWNNLIKNGDDVYILGDIILGDNLYGLECLKKLKGNLYIILGNHDTKQRIDLYKQLVEYNFMKWKCTAGAEWGIDYPTTKVLGYADMLKYKKYNFYLSHYPTFTGNGEDYKKVRAHVINLHGHTHSASKFYVNNPYIYNVALDAHNMTPVSIDEIISDIREYVDKHSDPVGYCCCE